MGKYCDMRLEKEIRGICQKLGLNEKAGQRLAGSLKVLLPQNDDGSNPKQIEIGLRLLNIESGPVVSPSVLHAVLEQALQEYASAAPAIINWVGRGDFNPDTPPVDLNNAKITHANRTVGRIRAKALRSLSKQAVV